MSQSKMKSIKYKEKNKKLHDMNQSKMKGIEPCERNYTNEFYIEWMHKSYI